VNSFVLPRCGDVLSTKSTPQEQQRLQVPRAFLERTIRNLNEHVQGCTAELIFNLDEFGISDWEDRKTRNAVVPATIDGQTIHHAVSRNVKYISGIVYMSAAWESLIPDIMASQNSSPVQEQPRTHCVRLGRDLILSSNHRAYATRKS
jgi:hypothetical protein